MASFGCPMAFRPNNQALTANTEILTESGVVRFIQVTGPEQGPYICTATNEVGSVTATAVLKIQGTPKQELVKACLIIVALGKAAAGTQETRYNTVFQVQVALQHCK